MSLGKRVGRLERLLPPPPADDEQRRKCLARLDARLGRLLRDAAGLMAAEEARPVEDALRLWNESAGGPFADWFRDLAEGRCGLPELSAGAAKALLLAWVSPHRDAWNRVCRRCGLGYPSHKAPPLSEWKALPGRVPLQGPPPWYDLPDFFTGCPGCGASVLEMDWAHLVPAGTHAGNESEGRGGATSTRR